MNFSAESGLTVLEAETLKVPHAEKLLSIKGVGLVTVICICKPHK